MFGQEGSPVLVHFHCRVIVIVKPGTLHFGVVKGETEWLDQVQLGARVGAQANDVAGVGWNFGFYQYDVEQGLLLLVQ